jgi:hypothetical protein
LPRISQRNSKRDSKDNRQKIEESPPKNYFYLAPKERFQAKGDVERAEKDTEFGKKFINGKVNKLSRGISERDIKESFRAAAI